MARVKTHKKSDSADEWLDTQGFYRKPTARDGSCLFRAVSEQVFNTQAHHLGVRVSCANFMDKYRENFEEYVDGYFEHYLSSLRNPKEWAGQLEMNAMSLMYKKDFVVFQDEDKQQYQMTDNNFHDKIFLYFTDGNHYDSVYPKIYLESAAFCQSIVYDLLYKKVFNLGAEVDYAVEKMLHDKEYAKQRKDSATSQDGIYDKSSSPSPDFLFEPNETEIDENDEDGGSQIRRALSRGFPPFPYKVAKALDPDIYRNVELDVWNEQRKEPQFEPGVKCLVRSDKDIYHAHIQEIGQNKKFATVYIEELGEKKTLAIESLEPLPTPPQKNQHWNLPVKACKPSIGYYQKTNSKTPVGDYDQNKGKKKNKKKDGYNLPPAMFSTRSQFETQPTYSRGRASPPIANKNRSPSPRLKWTQSGQQNQNNFSRFRAKNGSGGRYGSQGNFHNPQPMLDKENAHKIQCEKEIYDYHEQDLAAFPALPKSQGNIPSNSTSSRVNTVWARNNTGNGNHQSRQQTPTLKSNVDNNKQVQQEVNSNCVPRTASPPIPIIPPPSSNSNVSVLCNVPNPIQSSALLSPNSPVDSTSMTFSCTLSSPVLPQELNQQYGGPITIPPPHSQGLAMMTPQQTPPPPSTFGYLPFPQMYPASVIPFPEPAPQSVNFNAGRSQDPNGNDLPLSDLPTLRFFYNLGHDYFRMSSTIFPPVHQQQSFMWNYGTPIAYSPVNSFTPPPLIGSEPGESLEESTCNGNGQCSMTGLGEQGVRIEEEPQPLDRGDEMYDGANYDVFPEFANLYVTPTEFKGNLVIDSKTLPQDGLVYTGYQAFEMAPPPPHTTNSPYQWPPTHCSQDVHFVQPRRQCHGQMTRQSFNPNRSANLPPRFQRRNSSGGSSSNNNNNNNTNCHQGRKDKSRYEGQPLLQHLGRTPTSSESVEGKEGAGFSEGEFDKEGGNGVYACSGDLCRSLNPSSPLTVSSCNVELTAASSLGFYQSPGSPTSNPSMLATPPAIYYTNAPYVYHQPPPSLPQQMSYLPAAVQ